MSCNSHICYALQFCLGCRDNVRPLGMSSFAIPNANITVSSSYSDAYIGFKGRLNLYSEWCGNRSFNAGVQYLQVFSEIDAVYFVVLWKYFVNLLFYSL